MYQVQHAEFLFMASPSRTRRSHGIIEVILNTH